MKAYHFDENGFFQGSSDAFPNPLEPGQFLLPAFSTFTPVPDTALPAGQNYRWDGAAWVAATDPKITEQQAIEQRMAEQRDQEERIQIRATRRNQPVVYYDTLNDNRIVAAALFIDVQVDERSTAVTGPNGLPLTDPSNANLAALIFPEGTTLPTLRNAYGTPTQKVDTTTNTIVPRLAATITSESTPVAWDRLRAERDVRITRTDYTQMPDYPITAELKTAYQTYRQQLRDLPQNTTDPFNPVWPAHPEGTP